MFNLFNRAAIFRFFFILIVGSGVLMSCESPMLESHSNSSKDTDSLPYGNRTSETPRGIYFPNGMTSDSENNMLEFATFEEYEQVLFYLEENVEIHEDAFIEQYDDLDEEELNEMEEKIGFNEDLPLELFENEHHFQSLRKVTSDAENVWLDNSDQPEFSWEDDPDNFTFISGIEQTLYNPWNEVMINDTIYKYTENGYYSIVANNPKASSILAFINNNPEVNPIKIQYNFEGILVYYDDGDNTSGNDCVVGKINRTKRFENGDYSMKVTQEMYSASKKIVYKSITKNYKKKKGKWAKRRILSFAGIQGQVQDPNLNLCNVLPYMNVHDNRCTYKKRRKGEYSLKFNKYIAYNHVPAVKHNGFWSVHNQRGWVVEWEFQR